MDDDYADDYVWPVVLLPLSWPNDEVPMIDKTPLPYWKNACDD